MHTLEVAACSAQKTWSLQFTPPPQSRVLSLTCLYLALRTVSVFLYSNSIQSIIMKIQELHLFSEGFKPHYFFQKVKYNNIGWFFINSLLVILVPVEQSCFMSALSCYRNSKSSMIAFRFFGSTAVPML